MAACLRAEATTVPEKHSSRSQEFAPITERPWEALPAELVRALRPGVPETVEEIIATIRREVPAYDRPLRGSFGQAIRLGVERALADFLDAVEGKPVPEQAGARDVYAELGRGEVREGRTMEALLAAYRVGARVAWRYASQAAREADFDPDMLALLAEGVFAYIDQLSARSAAGFAEEQSAAAGEAARRRRALLTLLVQQPPAEPTAIDAAAREVGWELPRSLAALVWRDESEQPVSGRLPLGSLTSALDDGLLCALVPDADAPGRRDEIEAALGRRRAALGPSVPGAEAWRSAHRARALHRLLADGVIDGGLVFAEEHLADLIVHGDAPLAQELAGTRLEPLAGLSPASRE